MFTENEIRELATYLTGEKHSRRIANQTEDKSYYDDTFDLPLLKDSKYIIRTGAPARLIDGITEQIVTSNPQVFNEVRKKTKTSSESAANVASEMNRWTKYLNKQTPNPYKQTLKNLLVVGDSYIYVVHNDSLPENWQSENPELIPARFLVYDPMVVFYDPDAGEEYGVPNRVIVQYERSVIDIQNNYPDWVYTGNAKKVKFLAYFDKESRYMEAGGTKETAGYPLLKDGIQENIYKVVPFVHIYSGFGHESFDKDPASLAVGRIRKIKDLYKEECTIRTDLSMIVHKLAMPFYLLLNRSGQALSPDALANFSMEAGTVSILTIPPGTEFDAVKGLLPDQAVFNYYAMIRSDISAEDAPILHGFPTGSSGRQDDIALRSGMKLYESVINNTAQGWATVLDMGMKMTDLPTMRPPNLKDGDINQYCDTRVELRAKDPLEQDRLRALGSRLYSTGEIDLETNLTKYQGYTQEESRDIMAKILADNATRNNPVIAQIMGEQAVREIGMEEQAQALKEQTDITEKNLPNIPQIGSKGGEPRVGNIKTPQGREMIDLSTQQGGIRRPPQV